MPLPTSQKKMGILLELKSSALEDGLNQKSTCLSHSRGSLRSGSSDAFQGPAAKMTFSARYESFSVETVTRLLPASQPVTLSPKRNFVPSSSATSTTVCSSLSNWRYRELLNREG